MSTAAKVTFATSCVVALCTVFGVHYVQNSEREALKQGPIKDAERRARKQKLQENDLTAEEIEKQKKRARLQQEYDLQKKLREEYSAVQPLSGVTVVGEDKSE